MLRVVTGPLYSDLEDAIAEHLKSFRVQYPIEPLTIVVPSQYARLRLQWVLCTQRNLSLFHVHILTFFQLALQLVEEQGQLISDAIRSDNFFREYIHQLMRRRKTVLPHLAGLTEIPGAWTNLWKTIKDLKNGAVDAQFAREVLRHNFRDIDPICESVFMLYDSYCEEQNRLQIFDCDDVAKIAKTGVASSTFLSQQRQIWYYGFYDLTQVQLDLFHAVAQSYTTSVYFPIVRDHPAYQFAQQFFDRHILGLSVESVRHHSGGRQISVLQDLFAQRGSIDSQQVYSDSHPADENCKPTCQIVYAPGGENEMRIVCKEILRHVEENQIPWHEIGVVGRTLSGYEQVLPRVFYEHGIPFNTTMQRSLVAYPYAQILLRLLSIFISDFQRDHVMEVLTSPYFHWRISSRQRELPRPDLWDRASRRMGIAKGLEEWKRFIRAMKNECMVSQDASNERNWAVLSDQQIDLCDTTLNDLFEGVARFPLQATYEEFVARTLQLMNEFLVVPYTEQSTKSMTLDLWTNMHSLNFEQHNHAQIFKAVCDQFRDIRLLTKISEVVTISEFVKTVQRFFEGALVPVHQTTDNIQGVWVLDAMAARGFSFRVLFVVGMNEHVFPRHIREDAFLRDSVRRFLDVNLGFKVPEKVSGYEEEQLLFYLLVNSATDAVTLLTQRADTQDQPSVPSWYLNDFQRCVGDIFSIVVSKRLGQKRSTLSQYADKWLTSEEIRIGWMFDRCLPGWGLAQKTPGWLAVRRGVTSLASQESSSPRLNRFDGMTGNLPEWWDAMQSRGMSPTALKEYAICPFKFFAKHVLKVDPIDRSEFEIGLGVREIGSLLHQLFRECLLALSAHGYYQQMKKSSAENISELLQSIFVGVFQHYEQSYPTGHPLVWEWQQEQLSGAVSHAIYQEFFNQDEDWISVGLEQPIKGIMPLLLDDDVCELSLSGRIDRIDWSPSQHTSRIIDYKYKASPRSILTSQALAREVVRCKELQPPLYFLLIEGGTLALPNYSKLGVLQGLSCSGVWFHYLTADSLGSIGTFTSVPFTASRWKSLKPQIEKNIKTLMTGIQRGEYFIVPGSDCRICDFRTICHRTQSLSRWRAEVDRAQTKGHRDVRFTKLATIAESDREAKKK